MSSRTAAARKRLAPGDTSRPSPSKGFFSRSKPTPVSSSPLRIPDKRSATPSKGPNSLNFDGNSPSADPYHLNLYANSDATINSESSRAASFGQASPPGAMLYQAPYNMSRDSQEFVSHQTIRLNGRSRGNGGPDDYGEGLTYIEASYQPPPPMLGSYQPPPPSHSVPINDTTDFHRKPTHAILPNDLPAQAAPRTHNFSLPSPLSSPAPSSRSLRRSSPTPTELPTYSSVHETSRFASNRNGQASYEFPSRDFAQPASRNGYHPRYDSQIAHAAPPPRPQRFTPSPLHIPDFPSPPSTAPLPGGHDFRQPWLRGTGGSGAPSSSGSSSSERNLSPSLSSIRYPDSTTSGSSDSSGTRSPVPNAAPPSASAQSFVFPGSRSVARPKASSKIVNGKAKLDGKSRARGDSDASNSTSAPARPIVNTNDIQGNGHAIMHPEPSSALSDGSGASRSPVASVKSTNSSMGPPKAVYPMGRSRAQPSKGPKIKPPKPLSSISEGDQNKRAKKFMGLLKRKKNTKNEPSYDTQSISQSSGSSKASGSSNYAASEMLPTPSSTPSAQDYRSQETSFAHQQSRERATRVKSRLGEYPLDPYDSVLLDNDRHTGELLVRLNPTASPSFHNYGNNPPSSVLDLGCGQGHWVVDAAIAWKGYGTRVTGYDVVDMSEGLLPWAAEQGVSESIRFVRGNFLKQRLPFSDNSFDLVRMSCLALCVTSDSWVFVLQEVCRVLIVGGRVELIDDLIFFPYGKASAVSDPSEHSPTQSIAPRIDVSIPSASFTTFSIHDGDTTNPGLGPGDDEDDFFDYYATNEDDADFDDTATLNGREAEPAISQSIRSRTPSRRRTSSPGINAQTWNRMHATSGDVEALFDHMLTHKFGIKKEVHEYILDMMKSVFGHAHEVKTMHLVLAPPETAFNSDELSVVGGRSNLVSSRASMGLSSSPGLILWPSTLIPMDHSEIEIHASKHLRMLLSCKNYLLEHAVEATDDSEIDEESVREALWEYEGFLRYRFNPPSPQPQGSSDDPNDLNFDAASIRGSIAESVTSDFREAMWEIQSDFQQHFGWRRAPSSEGSLGSRSPTPNGNLPTSARNAFAAPASPPIPTVPSPTSTIRRRSSSSAEENSLNVVPLYSRDELTHVRTFRVYEAIKIDEALFGSTM
ncbi:hypothetical protein HYPSUDRAFT_209347 [Hypholoma sublateritium FD-334 SS-4]|uniref:Methyltransferase domain-containing protein n=1 Tax=Hypholoma sublateritium (strain FD-334 SS-4) TaxID=945553 RepID=A0A0D2LSB2_HYPSF|nr:hypothetical protein HYPSUDRAFT_209347 [Hypholoma sublateritium FD-334 SS-4]